MVVMNGRVNVPPSNRPHGFCNSRPTAKEKLKMGMGCNHIAENLKILCKEGRLREALDSLLVMEERGIWGDAKTCATLVQECIGMKDLRGGKLVHNHVKKAGLPLDVFLGNNLVNMYAKCGCLADARHVFDKMLERNVVSWSIIIAGYAQLLEEEQALELFYQMQQAGVKPNQSIFASVLRACGSLGDVRQGKNVHSYIIKFGFEWDVCAGSGLVSMYAKCGWIEDAQKVFDKVSEPNVVVWSSVIGGYAQNGQPHKALQLFCQMQLTGLQPNKLTFVSVVSACSNLQALHQGKAVHALIIKNRLQPDVLAGSALLTMYAKCNSIDDARNLFDRIAERNVITWTAMISGYAHNGNAEEALKLFHEMELAGLKPNQYTFTSVLSACAALTALEQGIRIHHQIIKRELELESSVGNAIITMYARCGKIDDARHVFDKMPKRNVSTWNAMVTGYAQHGLAEDALELFEQLQQSGMKPNQITFVAILVACSRAGLVNEGRDLFYSMSRDHGVIPTIEHYASMLDLLGRAGCLNEAEDFLKQMPFQPSALIWRTLLGACKIHGNVELGKRAAERILELEPENDAAYVLLANIYAAAGKWVNVAHIRNLMKDRKLKKEPGHSSIEVQNKTYTFVSRDRSHPQTREIYAKLEEVNQKIKDAGYVPDINVVLHDVEEKQKEYFLSHHSEKLAIAFGLICNTSNTTIRVVKNLRVCADCHTAIKFISKILGHEIIVRDSCRFHHFKNGLCSCRDYW